MRKYIKNVKYIFNLWLPSIRFNFHYLPFTQAIKLPILLMKPKFLGLRGKVIIDSSTIKTGMIQMGFNMVDIYPDSGITWNNRGTVIFKGETRIGSDSYISVGATGNVTFGNNFRATAALKLVSYIGVEFGEFNNIGWNSLIMDTNFHPIYDMEKERFKKAYGRIRIGDYNWLGNQCIVMHSVETPERCIFGLRSTLTRGCQYESYCVHGGNPLHVLSRNVMRIPGQDTIIEYK